MLVIICCKLIDSVGRAQLIITARSQWPTAVEGAVESGWVSWTQRTHWLSPSCTEPPASPRCPGHLPYCCCSAHTYTHNKIIKLLICCQVSSLSGIMKWRTTALAQTKWQFYPDNLNELKNVIILKSAFFPSNGCRYRLQVHLICL